MEITKDNTASRDYFERVVNPGLKHLMQKLYIRHHVTFISVREPTDEKDDEMYYGVK